MELDTMQTPCFSSKEFDFNSGRTSPCGSGPSTPRGFRDDYYFSAPTSPMIYGGVESYDDLGNNGYARGLYATNTKSKSPIKLEAVKSPLLFPQSPKSTKSHNKKKFWSHFSPKRSSKKEPLYDETTTIMDNNKEPRTKQGRQHREIRERQVTRSLSPLRVSKYPWEEQQLDSISMPPSPTLPLSSSSKGGKKWRLKDLLLFRSASEGRALDNKDPMKKHLYMQWRHEVDNKASTISRRGTNISAHELHYKVNKAISEDMKKKSFLPYKQGILGRLAINPTVHALAHGFGSLAHT